MTHKVAEMASGVGVIADVGYPPLGKQVAADLKNPFANSMLNPRIDPVNNDEVEGSKFVEVPVAEIHRLQSHVAQSELCDQLLTRCNGNPPEINANEFTFGQLKGHRRQITGRPTP